MKKFILLFTILLASCNTLPNGSDKEITSNTGSIKAEVPKVLEVRDYSGLTEEQIENIELLKQRAREQEKLSNHEQALEYYKQVLEIVPTDFEANYRIGYIFRRVEDYQKSNEYFAMAISDHPKLSFVITPIIALNYDKMGNEELYQSYIKKATEQKEDYFFTYEYDAIDRLNETLSNEEYEKRVEIAIQYFYTFYNNPQYTNLVELFDSTWKYGFSELRVAHMYEGVGFKYRRVENYEKAAEYFTQAYETVAYPNAILMAGNSYYSAGDYESAEEILSAYYEFNPYDMRMYWVLLDIYAKSENLEKYEIFLQIYEDAIKYYDDNGYWNTNSTFAKFNFIDENSEKKYKNDLQYQKDRLKELDASK